jgi:hypothetical protein
MPSSKKILYKGKADISRQRSPAKAQIRAEVPEIIGKWSKSSSEEKKSSGEIFRVSCCRCFRPGMHPSETATV